MAKSSFKQEHPLGMLWCSLCFCLCIAVSVSRIFNPCMSRKVVISGMCANLNICYILKMAEDAFCRSVLGVLCTNCCLQIFFSESILALSCWVLYLGCLCQPQSLAVHISVKSSTSTFVFCCNLKQLVGMNVKWSHKIVAERGLCDLSS
jgi:hypothetical protein